ncbi:MAG: hypothetical protein ACRD6B_16995 [Bryobacteraceae bacterium]
MGSGWPQFRPRDRLAWLLLVYLLGFTTFASPWIALWESIARDFGAIYWSGLHTSWNLWLLVLAIYFPEPLAADSPGRTVWKWTMWIVVLPLAFQSVVNAIVSAAAIGSYSSISWWNQTSRTIKPTVYRL